MKNIYLIVSPDRAAVAERLDSVYNLKAIQPYTTRPPRFNGETGFNFISNKEFDILLCNASDIAVYVHYIGYRYGVKVEQLKPCDSQIYVIDSYSVDPVELERVCANYSGVESIKIIYVDTDFGTSIQHMLRKYSAEEQNLKYGIETVYLYSVYSEAEGYQPDYDDVTEHIFDIIYQCEALGGQNEQQGKFRTGEM